MQRAIRNWNFSTDEDIEEEGVQVHRPFGDATSGARSASSSPPRSRIRRGSNLRSQVPPAVMVAIRPLDSFSSSSATGAMGVMVDPSAVAPGGSVTSALQVGHWTISIRTCCITLIDVPASSTSSTTRRIRLCGRRVHKARS